MITKNYKIIKFKIDEETEIEFRKFQAMMRKQKGEVITLGETLKILLGKVDTNSFKICAFPECKNPFFENHHPDRQALSDSKRIVPLCRTHHIFAHARMIGDEEFPVDKWYLITGKINPLPITCKDDVDLKVQQHWN